MTSRRIAVAGLLATIVVACSSGEDPRVANLSVGISRDSALTAMGGVRPSRIDPYLYRGQYIEAMYYLPPETEPLGTDTVPDRERTPVVVINGLVTGWGWGHWDSVATANGIIVAPPR